MAGEKHWIVVTIFGMAAMAMSLLHPIMPLYPASIDISPEIIGLMISTSVTLKREVERGSSYHCWWGCLYKGEIYSL